MKDETRQELQALRNEIAELHREVAAARNESHKCFHYHSHFPCCHHGWQQPAVTWTGTYPNYGITTTNVTGSGWQQQLPAGGSN